MADPILEKNSGKIDRVIVKIPKNPKIEKVDFRGRKFDFIQIFFFNHVSIPNSNLCYKFHVYSTYRSKVIAKNRVFRKKPQGLVGVRKVGIFIPANFHKWHVKKRGKICWLIIKYLKNPIKFICRVRTRYIGSGIFIGYFRTRYPEFFIGIGFLE